MTRSIELNYARKPRRRSRRPWLIALGVLICVAVAGWWWALPLAWQRVELIYWRRECLDYFAPTNQLIYDEKWNAAEIARSIPVFTHGLSAPGRFVAENPKCWSNFWRAKDFSQRDPDPPVFLHQLSSPRDGNRLVAIFFDGWYDDAFLQFHARIDDGTRNVVFDLPSLHPGTEGPGSLQIFAGQIDPTNPSHFTIPYEMNGTRGTIDGWLRDRDLMRFQLRPSVP